MTRVLVTGGAGYIGSHTVRELKKAGFEILIYDNLSTGHREAVEGFNLVVGDLEDKGKLKKTFENFKPEAVIHFAGSIEAGESVTDPQRFFKNNLVNSLNLLEVMVEKGIKEIIFSSSAAVYGEPEKNPVTEKTPPRPTNPYGLTKLMFEQILEAYDKAYGLKSISLRYFNAAGADPSGEIGADHKLKTHLITIVMLAALGKTGSIRIFGTDYKTSDGTCVRDYIHVNDLASAHVLALQKLKKEKTSDIYNLGTGQGYSVREVIETAKKVTGINFKIVEEGRRAGDPEAYFASSLKAQEELSWRPKFPTLKEIIETAWKWHSKHPEGYKSVKSRV